MNHIVALKLELTSVLWPATCWSDAPHVFESAAEYGLCTIDRRKILFLPNEMEIERFDVWSSSRSLRLVEFGKCLRVACELPANACTEGISGS